MLVLQGRVKAGEWVLINGVSPGVGVATLQLGKALGAKVIGPSGSAEKLDRMKNLRDRKSVESGQSVSVRLDLGGRRLISEKHSRQANTRTVITTRHRATNNYSHIINR